jgi:tetratricopeptide (TPR) repeat protein
LARTLHADRDLPRAVSALRAAVASAPLSGAGRTARLDDLTELGQLLAEQGELDEAENVLRQALGERATFYGVEHPGYAFGLGALAAFELLRGRVVEARCLCDQALHVLLEAGHPRAGGVAALRAFAVLAQTGAGAGAEAGVELYACADALDRPALIELVHSVLDRAEYAEPRRALSALIALWPIALRRLGGDHELGLHVAVAICNRARESGEHRLRIETFGWLIQALDRAGDRERAVDAVLGLALAASDAGDARAAERHHRDALERAGQLGAGSRSLAQRNYGLFLASSGRRAEAERALDAAVGEARAADDAALIGRALTALGIFQAHGGERKRARENLAAGLSLLARTDPDALCGQSHLEALLRRDFPDRPTRTAARRG